MDPLADTEEENRNVSSDEDGQRHTGPDEDERRNIGFFGDDADDDDLNPEAPAGRTICIVCQVRPQYSNNGKIYPTCGLRCAAILEKGPSRSNTQESIPGEPFIEERSTQHADSSTATPVFRSSLGRLRASSNLEDRGYSTTAKGRSNSGNNHYLQRFYTPPYRAPCVVCILMPCSDPRFVTCSLECAEKLCNEGSANPNMCNYCHRKLKASGSKQCSQECIDKAKVACLLCKSRPKFKLYHLCGLSCKQISTKATPRILEAPPGHTTYDFVLNKFAGAWNVQKHIPVVKNVHKIIESADFLRPYDEYKRTVGNEVFHYHGTTRLCELGTNTTKLCDQSECALCSILRTSFKTSLANPKGAFGPGIYSSSAANKAYRYCEKGKGAIILAKVILGNVCQVQQFKEVNSCPPGYNSVVFDKYNGTLNVTVVYSDDAIRPVFLITF